MLTRIDQANADISLAAPIAEQLRLFAGEMWRLSQEDPHLVLIVRQNLERAASDIDAVLQSDSVARAEALARSVA